MNLPMGRMILLPGPRAAFASLGLRWKSSEVPCAFLAGVPVVMTRYRCADIFTGGPPVGVVRITLP